MASSRFEVYFSGRVQGVGFRYTAKQVASSFDVVGTVQNLPDRRVKMVVEGEAETIESFIQRVCESTHGNVAETEISRFPATGRFSGFEIVV
jgi:acylphosphatase